MLKRTLATLSLLLSATAHADEGMWQPHQLQELKADLVSKGLTLDPANMQRLDQFPMNAVISLGGCTASFVSPKGLAVTNHHCAYGSIQYNSSEERNLIKQGFVAKKHSEELQAAPGSRIYVTESVSDVTQDVLGAVDKSLAGAAYYSAVEAQEKALVAQCESDKSYRCEVFSFHGGAEYYLIKLLSIRDVRLVYVPPASIGAFGGDTDNWMWPRHTGDWSFYRAYVGPDGKPADYSEDNVPYEPAAHLSVSASGIAEDDFVMVLGYPGRTNRYRTAEEVENQFTWTYPKAKQYREDYMTAIEGAAEKGSDAYIKYQSTMQGLANYAKNYGSMIRSYEKGDMLERKRALNEALQAWIEADSDRSELYGESIDRLNQLVVQSQQHQARDLILAYMGRTNMWSVSKRLYRLAHERAKPDAEREPGYQERDMTRFTQRMKRVNRRYDALVDQAVLLHFIEVYSGLPAGERVAALDTYFGLSGGFDKQKVAAKLAEMHQATELGEETARLAWMEKSVAQFKTSNDPFVQFAVAMYDHNMAVEKADKAVAGELQKARPEYMKALIAYKESRNEPVYADANSSLRITYGTVAGYSPQDGLVATPFTTLEGMLAKYIAGDDEFDMPKVLRTQIRQGNYGRYANAQIKSVPVNFLSTVDTTGGNSGSPTLNGQGHLVGLLFDGVYESIVGDWDYDKNLNRSIHASTPYMLWIMENVDNAQNLLDEMTIVE